MEEPLILIRNLTKIYRGDGCETPALRGVNLEVAEGDYLAVMGTSGSGKSTLLHIIGGMDTLTDGEYFYRNLPIQQMKAEELHRFRREHISFIFQNFALMRFYTVEENIEIPLLAKGVGKSERRQIAKKAMEQVGISQLAKKKVTQISGGEQQRCAIARAIASGNELILADEPTGSLDKKNSQEIMKLLTELNRQGKTVILITHDSEVAAYANKTVWISDGYIIEGN